MICSLLKSPPTHKFTHWGGLLLQKPFYAGFVDSGIILGDPSDTNCKVVHPTETLHFCATTSLEEPQQAIQKWIDYSCRLAEIARFRDPLAVQLSSLGKCEMGWERESSACCI